MSDQMLLEEHEIFEADNSKFEVGDYVRSYDFEPMSDREDRFVEGVIVDKVEDDNTYHHYVVSVYVDKLFPENKRNTVQVPMYLSISEFKDRIKSLD